MRKRTGLFIGILILCLLWFICACPGIAAGEHLYSPSGTDYDLPEDSNYDYSSATPMGSFFYGAKSMGTFSLSGAIERETVYNGYTAYGATGEISIRYTYSGAYSNTDAESWHVEADGTRWIRDYDLGFLNNTASGCIMIEKSSDGENWEKVIDPIKNYFSQSKSQDEALIYSIPEVDFKNGMYYRVVVAYRFGRRTGTTFLNLNDQYERRKCVEVYEFFVASERNYITIQDMRNGSDLGYQDSTSAGFIIRKNGSNAVVTVQNHTSHDFEYFVEPGEYSITVATILDKRFTKTITVTNGLDFTVLEPTAYESEKDKGFPLASCVNHPAFGSNMTSLSIAIPKGYDLKQKESRYGITGDSVSLYLKLNHSGEDLGSGWKLAVDSWGKNKNQLVNGIETGEVGRGALIIQTSNDGVNWSNVDCGRYESGLYTTDYASHYGQAESVLIYTPSGQEVINGIHIRVLFAYQVNHPSQKEYRDYVEVYQFYLCSNELGAVTFHNLSVTDTLDETFADADQNTVEVYRQAESLVDGGYTATGFQIDNKLNPTVKYEIRRNGTRISPNLTRHDRTGKYDITLSSAVGSTKALTIYVDRSSPEEAMQQYFGDGFISGKRIFSEGELPVYEGGEINYFVAGVDENVLPLYGQITNQTTGSVITIEQNHDEKTGVISEPGLYQAVFATSENVFADELTGDARVFTFRFQVIPQGQSPGPVVNQKLLGDYSRSTATDCRPVYYGLTYSSAGKGNITLAFATREAAVEYAYQYEKGTVEKQEDGGYRYTGSFLVGQKIKFDSTWDLTDAVNYFAEAAVQTHFFDISDEFTYLSLSTEVLDRHPNLRQLELERSVTIFADGQVEELADTDALPLLNDKPYAYLNPESGEVERGFYSFEFVTDQHGGIDSKTVTITDSEGGKHDIRYSEGVGQQLLADKCPSGVVTIREETMYGDVAEYPAVYIAPGDNTTALSLTYTQGDDSVTGTYSSADHGLTITAKDFRITGLNDPLDPYALVIIKHKQYEVAYSAKDSLDVLWSDPGQYSITCVNRLGYGYTISLIIDGPADATGKDMPVINVPEHDYAIVYQSQSLSSTGDGRGVTRGAPEGAEAAGNAIPIIIGILVGAGIIAGLVIFFRRIRLFSRVSDSMKSEGRDEHE